MYELYIDYGRLRQVLFATDQQLALANKERQFWFKNFAVSKKFPTLLAMTQVDRASDTIEQLHNIRDFYQQELDALETFLQTLDGLEHRVAYLHIIGGAPLYDVAEQLGYSYDYIRAIHSKLKRQKRTAAPLA